MLSILYSLNRNFNPEQNLYKVLPLPGDWPIMNKLEFKIFYRSQNDSKIICLNVNKDIFLKSTTQGHIQYVQYVFTWNNAN